MSQTHSNQTISINQLIGRQAPLSTFYMLYSMLGSDKGWGEVSERKQKQAEPDSEELTMW